MRGAYGGVGVMKYLVIDDIPFETDDMDIVLEKFNRGCKIYKEVHFVTLDKVRDEWGL